MGAPGQLAEASPPNQHHPPSPPVPFAPYGWQRARRAAAEGQLRKPEFVGRPLNTDALLLLQVRRRAAALQEGMHTFTLRPGPTPLWELAGTGRTLIMGPRT